MRRATASACASPVGVSGSSARPRKRAGLMPSTWPWRLRRSLVTPPKYQAARWRTSPFGFDQGLDRRAQGGRALVVVAPGAALLQQRRRSAQREALGIEPLPHLAPVEWHRDRG